VARQKCNSTGGKRSNVEPPKIIRSTQSGAPPKGEKGGMTGIRSARGGVQGGKGRTKKDRVKKGKAEMERIREMTFLNTESMWLA